MPSPRQILAALVLLSPVYSLPALANCDGNTQMEMNQCAAGKVEEATRTMKLAFNELHARLGTEDKAELFKSQVAWIQYMRAWCHALTSSSTGGSIRPLQIYLCRETLTRAREKELRSF